MKFGWSDVRPATEARRGQPGMLTAPCGKPTPSGRDHARLDDFSLMQSRLLYLGHGPDLPRGPAAQRSGTQRPDPRRQMPARIGRPYGPRSNAQHPAFRAPPRGHGSSRPASAGRWLLCFTVSGGIRQVAGNWGVAVRAVTVVPGKPGSAEIIEVPDPPLSDGGILARGRLIGICETDAEILNDGYGTIPDGADRLVLGHESLGEVIEAPPETGLQPGDLISGVVRPPTRSPARRAPPAKRTCAATDVSPSAASPELRATAASCGELTRITPSRSTRPWAISACCWSRRPLWPGRGPKLITYPQGCRIARRWR